MATQELNTPSGKEGKEGEGDEKTLMRSLIPEDLHDRGYLKDFLDLEVTPESHAAVYKKLDESQKLLGRKGIPGTDATEDEVSKFYGQLRLEKPEDYEVLKREGTDRDEEFVKAIQKVFHDADVSAHQSKKMQTGLFAMIDGHSAAQVEAQKAADEAFNAVVKATFSDDAEAKKVFEVGEAHLKEHTPKNLQAHLGKLDNESLTILIGVAHNMAKAYGKEDGGLGGGDAGGTGGSEDIATLREEARTIMASEAFKDFQHSKYDAAIKRKDEIYLRITELEKKS